MRRFHWFGIAVVLVSVVLGVVAPSVVAGPDGSATVRFGNDDVGSGFPPITGHDASGNGKFNLIPRTVTISRGGSVTFDIFIRFGFHEPKVYEAGTTLDDIDVQLPIAQHLFVDEDEGLVASGPRVGAAQRTASWTTPPGTFDRPGRYLVLCNFAPHFAEFGMYGWVQVK